MVILLGYLASILMGISLGLLGGGGSILNVPILVYLFKINPLAATHYSLFIVGLTSLVGGHSYFKNKEVNFKVGLNFAIPSFFGVYFSRSYILPYIPDIIFERESFLFTKPLLMMLTFSIIMVLASLKMLRQSQSVKETNSKSVMHVRSYGLMVGLITGFVGVGGGFLIIPALVVMMNLPMRVAVGTSLVIIASNSMIGFIGGFKANTEIDWFFLIKLSALSITGLFVGKKISNKISEKKVKIIFAYLVLLMGLFIFTDQILKIVKLNLF